MLGYSAFHKNKKGEILYSIELGDKTERVVIISQLRLIDAKRLYQKINILGENYKKIQNAVLVYANNRYNIRGDTCVRSRLEL